MCAYARAIICLSLLLSSLAFAQEDYEIQIGSFDVDGSEVHYVLGELLIKPTADLDVSSFVPNLGGALLDSIPRIE